MSTWLKSILRSSRQPLAWELSRSTPRRRSGRANQRGNRWKRSRCRTRIDRLCKNNAPGRALPGPSRTRRSCRINRGIDVDFPYTELINKEAEIIGVSDHLATELPALIEFARSGKLRFPPETLRVVDLDAAQINAALDALQDSIDHVRTVIVPRVTSDL